MGDAILFVRVNDILIHINHDRAVFDYLHSFNNNYNRLMKYHEILGIVMS